MPCLPRINRPRSRRAPEVGAPPDPRLSEPTPNGVPWVHLDGLNADSVAELAHRFGWHELDFEDVLSKRQRPKIDEYAGYLFVVLHFPRFDKSIGRLNAAELDIFIGPDYVITLPNEPLQPLEYLFERCRGNEEAREQHFSKGSGYLLYRIIDSCADASFPMLRKMGNKLERIEQDIFEGRSE